MKRSLIRSAWTIRFGENCRCDRGTVRWHTEINQASPDACSIANGIRATDINARHLVQ